MNKLEECRDQTLAKKLSIVGRINFIREWLRIWVECLPA
jgi:hypothetical protein